jgi:hypothetical protein
VKLPMVSLFMFISLVLSLLIDRHFKKIVQ